MTGTAEAFDRDLSALVYTCRERLPLFADPAQQLAELLSWVKRVQEAAEVMQEWLEADDPNDYRGMGWVGQDGRP